MCVFSLQDVKAAFAGSYRTLDLDTDQWKMFLGNSSLLGQVTMAPHSPMLCTEPIRPNEQGSAASGDAPPPFNHTITASNRSKEIFI